LNSDTCTNIEIFFNNSFWQAPRW